MGIGNKVLVRMENIEKEFPGVKALKGVNFDVRAGEVHALVWGERRWKIHIDQDTDGGLSGYIRKDLSGG